MGKRHNENFPQPDIGLEVDFDTGVLLKDGDVVSPIPEGWKIGLIEVRALVAESAKIGKPLTSGEALTALYGISIKGVPIERQEG